MTHDLAPIETAATDKLLPETNDRSGIGAHYVDAYLKPLRSGVALPSGEKVSVKRRGLKLTLSIGPKRGFGLMRRATADGDPVQMMHDALDEAGAQIGAQILEKRGRLILKTWPLAPG